MIRGYYVYKDIWDAVDGEILECFREVTNRHDPFTVAVKKQGFIVSHFPKKISTACSMFMKCNGIVRCQVSGSRQYSKMYPREALKYLVYCYSLV